MRKIIDNKGRLGGKISILDVIVVALIIGLCATYGQRALSESNLPISSSNKTFYMTFIIEKLRNFSVNAVKEGDLFFEQNSGIYLGKTVKVESESAYDVLRRTDGTAAYVPLEGKYNLYITIECDGNVNAKGYFISGVKQLSAGSDLKIQSNRMSTNAKVYNITETYETET